MPLYVRKSVDHYPDRPPILGSKPDEHFIALCGNLIAGSISRVPDGPSEGVWHWGTSLGDGLTAGATAETFEACKASLAAAFRALLARAAIAERPDAKAGPPARDPPPPPAAEITAWKPAPPWNDADHPVVIHQPRRFTVRSGELLIGLIQEIDRVPWVGQWTWALSGTRPNPPAFVWKGAEKSFDQAPPRTQHVGRRGSNGQGFSRSRRSDGRQPDWTGSRARSALGAKRKGPIGNPR